LQNEDILVPREVGGEVPRPHVRHSAHYDQQIIRIQYTMAAEVGFVCSTSVTQCTWCKYQILATDNRRTYIFTAQSHILFIIIWIVQINDTCFGPTWPSLGACL
jgi:hypothetical protein